MQRPVDIKNRPRIPIPDEDPYSVAGVSSSVGPSEIMPTDRDSREQIYMQSTSYQHRRAERPPKLPPRENLYSHGIPKVNVKRCVGWILCIYMHLKLCIERRKLIIKFSMFSQPDYDDIEDDYGRGIKHPMMNEEKRSKHDDRKKYGETTMRLSLQFNKQFFFFFFKKLCYLE